jgi:hypothetical protein
MVTPGTFGGPGSSGVNFPGNTKFGFLRVSGRQSNLFSQEAMFGGDEYYIRYTDDGGVTWTDWEQIYHTGMTPDFPNMPQVGGDPIVESGSNSNGTYTKFADGTMICSRSQISVCNALGSGSLTDMYRGFPFDWTFPVSFVGTPILSSSVKINRPGADGFVVSNLGSMITSTSVTSVQMFRGTNISDTETCHLQAIGRWF